MHSDFTCRIEVQAAMSPRNTRSVEKDIAVGPPSDDDTAWQLLERYLDGASAGDGNEPC